MAKDVRNKYLAGQIIKALPNTMFLVKLDEEGKEVLTVPSGKMRRGLIKLMPGVRVLVEFTPYDDSRGRIVGKPNK